MIYLQLFLSFFQVGLFSFGGGLASLPLIKEQVVELHPWMTVSEFTDLISIAQMTPGPIAINSATFVGIRIAGIGGAILATFGCVLPSIIIVSLLAWFYFKFKDINWMNGVLSGLRPAAVALIASAGITIIVLAFWGEHGFSIKPSDMNWYSFAVFLIALVLLRTKKPSPILIILGAGVIGGIINLII